MTEANSEDTTGVAKPPPGHRWSPWRLARTRPRMIASLVVFVAIGVALILSGMRVANAVLLAFDLAAVVFLSILARLFNASSPKHMRQHAQTLDTGRWGVLWSGVILSTVVLVALANALHVSGGGGWLSLATGVASVILSWLFLNSMFAIHYAHGYYGDYGDQHAGLEFPETPKPDYWDFAYFSIVIGMTFQVSDVQITSNYLRRVVLLHSVIAFFFNVFIIAITVNIVAGHSA
jgi:uncharacterized membrane protein